MSEIDRRTGMETLSEKECWSLMKKASVGRLAVSIGGVPDIFPVNYVVDDRTVVVKTGPGTKLAAAVFGEGVAFEVDSVDEQRRVGWSIVIQGTAEEVEKLDDLMDVEALDVEPWAEGYKGRYLRITADRISGRRVPGHD